MIGSNWIQIFGFKYDRKQVKKMELMRRATRTPVGCPLAGLFQEVFQDYWYRYSLHLYFLTDFYQNDLVFRRNGNRTRFFLHLFFPVIGYSIITSTILTIDYLPLFVYFQPGWNFRALHIHNSYARIRWFTKLSPDYFKQSESLLDCSYSRADKILSLAHFSLRSTSGF